MDQDELTNRAKRVQEKYNGQLMALPRVVGTAVGLRKRQGQYTTRLRWLLWSSARCRPLNWRRERRCPGNWKACRSM